MSKAEYSSIGQTITLRADLSAFSKRDKLQLMQQLMTEFGFTDILMSDAVYKPAVDCLTTIINDNW